MPLRQAFKFTTEVTPGTTPASPAGGTVQLLRMSTPVLSEPKPIMWTVRDAGGSGRRTQTGSAQNDLRIEVVTNVYASQAAVLLKPFCTPIGGLPGLTTLTLDHLVALDVNAFTFKYLRWRGATPEKLVLRGTNSGQGVILTAALTYVARTFDRTITVTDFATPVLADYNTDQPMVFEQMAGHVTAGAITAGLKSFELDITNTLDLVYDENANPTPQFYGARDVNWKLDYRYTTQTPRTDYEAVAAKSVSFAVTDGTNTLTFNLQAANYYSGIDNERPLDKAFYQNAGGMAYLDTAAGTDFAFTIAP